MPGTVIQRNPVGNRTMVEPRPLHHLRAYTARYPNAWHMLGQMREAKGKDLPDWPDWCYLPLAASFAVLSRHGIVQVEEVGPLGALAAWRMTKGIYRFDPTVLTELWQTPIVGAIPWEVLLRLPEWCVYVDLDREEHADLMRGGELWDWSLHGYFAHLECDANTHRKELRLVLDVKDGLLLPLVIHLGSTLGEGIEQAIRESMRQTQIVFSRCPLAVEDVPALAAKLRKHVEPLISVLLYLCSDEPDIQGPGRPANPEPRRTKRGERLFATDAVRTWNVAYRIGASLRRACEMRGRSQVPGGRARPRPHVRRAHWHLYWKGPRSGPRIPLIRWLPPIPVGIERPETLPAVVRHVLIEAS